MDMNIFRGITTLVLMVLFIALCFWVYSKKRKPMYEEAAKMAIEETPEGEQQ